MAVPTKFSYLDEVNGGTKSWTIRVKILLLWKSYYNNNPEDFLGVDMVLMDEKGQRIVATVRKTMLPDFEDLLEEGGTRIISTFQVAEYPKRWRLIDHDSKVSFMKQTSMKMCDDFDSTHDGFFLLNFKDIIDGTLKFNCGFDVVVISSGDVYVSKSGNHESRVINCKIQNKRNEVMPVALWDAHAMKLQSYIQEKKNANSHVFIFIRLAKYKLYNLQPQVSNCLFGSKLYINEDIAPLTRFTKRYSSTVSDVSSSECYDLSSSTVVKNDAEDFKNNPYKQIDELIEINKNMFCVIVGRVIKIRHDLGWKYLACRSCMSKAIPSKKTKMLDCDDKPLLLTSEEKSDEDKLQLQVLPVTSEQESSKTTIGAYECKSCGTCPDVMDRIKLHITVQDLTGNTTIAMFERDVVKIIGKPASFVMTKFKKEEEFSLYPEEFKEMLSKRYAFVLKITDYNLKNANDVYTANKVSGDEDLIKAVESQSPNYQEAASECETPLKALDSSQSCVESKEVLSITGDNGTPIDGGSSSGSTPAVKRSIDEPETDMSVQSSSSKKSRTVEYLKIPKLEKE